MAVFWSSRYGGYEFFGLAMRNIFTIQGNREFKSTIELSGSWLDHGCRACLQKSPENLQYI